jgi:gentisate 1,2-dioxygenase
MSRALPTRDDTLPPEYSQALEALSIGPVWAALKMLLPYERVTAAVPHRWRWTDVRPLLIEASRLVTLEGATRRSLVLENPGLKGSYAIASTLYAGLQIILPGESAPSHHHTPSALRIVLEGQGAYTTVDGVKCVMERGDLIITPPMSWHDHGHEGTEPVIWLDGLDIPMVRSFDASWASRAQPAHRPDTTIDSSRDEFIAVGLVPRASRYKMNSYPMLRWPWSTVRRALADMAAGSPATNPAILRFVNPATGAPPLATIGCESQWLRPGESTTFQRRTASAVFHVIEGRGETRVGDTAIGWEQGDTFVVPPWHWFGHRNPAARIPACLFQFNDEPAVRSLGLWSEETR